ncbi:MAG: serine hydrolase domain-containing protein [Phycisphaerales bacterium]
MDPACALTLRAAMLIAVGVASPAATAATLLEIVRAKVNEHDVPALGALCIRADVVQEWAVAGVRKRGDDDPVTPQDLWHLGSCTKAMTATLAARLVDRDVMRWDMTIGEVFPDIRDDVRVDYLDVTLEQLVTNRGGIPRDVGGTAAWRNAWQEKGSLVEQRHRFMLDVLKMQPPNPAGEYLYSNQGFAIAGHMCEQVTGVAWEALMERELFGPLKMTSAGFGAPGGVADDQPVGHHSDGQPAEPTADNPPAISPAGRVHCRLGDWAKFVAVHLPGTPLRKNYLSDESFRRLHTPADGPGRRYAMGWAVEEREWGGTVLSHAGSNNMWYCVVWLSPERDFAVLATCNQAGDAAVKACDELCATMIQRELKRRPAGGIRPPPRPRRRPITASSTHRVGRPTVVVLLVLCTLVFRTPMLG